MDSSQHAHSEPDKDINARGTPTLTADKTDVFSLLTPQLYQRLRQLGRRYMRREVQGHTLHPTDVVHSALNRMRRGAEDYTDTQHFFASCAVQMRWVLVEYARKRKRNRQRSISIDDANDEALQIESESDELLLELHEALEQLAILDPVASKACDLYYFGGHSVQEITSILKISTATVDRKMRFAKAWMRSEFEGLRNAMSSRKQ